MSYKNKHNFFLILFILFFLQNVFGHKNIKSPIILKSSSNISDTISPISICKWKDDARTCLNISFDDNCISHNKISKIFDQYGYKATFFIISSFMFVDSLRDMSARGHEIGNHTYSHEIPFSKLDSTDIDFQIRKSQEEIEDAIGIKCVSFAEPWHNSTPESKSIAFKYHLFFRDYSKYLTYRRLDMNANMTNNMMSTYINAGISSGNMLIIDGHGIDADVNGKIEGDGYQPITENMLVQLLDTVKKHVDLRDIWITTLKEAQQYENLVHEVNLDKHLNNDTLTVQFQNYNNEKYIDVDSSCISIKIPKAISRNISCLTKSVKIKEYPDEYVLTLDLKLDTAMVIVLPNFESKTPIDSVLNDNLFDIYPNPVNNYLYFNVNGDVLSSEIYDLEGNELLNKIGDISKIDVSLLQKGFYLLKIYTRYNNSILINTKIFIKI